MRPTERQQHIEAAIQRQGEMTVEALALEFDVSAETIRRDLAQLVKRGALRKFHGGARRLHSEPSFADRMAENAGAKRTIAAKLALLVSPGETLFVDTGSTTLACAEALAEVPGLTIITNSLKVAQVMGRPRDGARVFLLGGAFSDDNAQTVGPMVIEQIARFQADRAVITVTALDAGAGGMDSDFDEAQVARAMIARSRSAAVLADLSKLGRRAAFQVCRLDEIDVLVCDGNPGDAALDGFARAGIEVY